MTIRSGPASETTAKTSLILPLVVAALSVLGAIGGAYLGSRATIITQREQAREERLAEARSQRANVYSDFLQAADRYHLSQTRIAASIKRAKLSPLACGRQIGTSSGSVCGVGTADLKTNEALRLDATAALFDVYAFGSGRGVVIAVGLSKAMPGVLGDSDRRFVTDDVNENSFAASYTSLLRVMCREASASPRRVC